MNFEIGKRLSCFGCLGILKHRFQCLKVGVNQQQYIEVAKESTTCHLASFCTIVFLRAFSKNCLNICVLLGPTKHTTSERPVMNPIAFTMFRVSLLVVPMVTGPQVCSSPHFFFCFVQGWEFFQTIHEYAGGNVPRESNEERQKSYLLLDPKSSVLSSLHLAQPSLWSPSPLAQTSTPA